MVATYMNDRNGGTPRTYTAINIRHRHQSLEEAIPPLASGMAAENHGENAHFQHAMHQPIQPSQPSLPAQVSATQQYTTGFLPPPFAGVRLNFAPGTFGNSFAATSANHGQARPQGLPVRGRDDGNGAMGNGAVSSDAGNGENGVGNGEVDENEEDIDDGPGDPFVARWLEENGY